MASYEARRAAGRRRHEKRMAKKAKGKRPVGKIVALVISVLLVTALCGGVAYVAMQWSKVQTEDLSAKDLSINREIEHDSGTP